MINLIEGFLNNFADEDDILIDDSSSGWITKKECKKKIYNWSKKLPKEKSLIFAFVDNKIDDLTFVFSCLQNNHCVALLDCNLPSQKKDELNQHYQPNLIFDSKDKENLLHVFNNKKKNIYHENFLLLSTSGSTGSPKFVSLSNENLLHNALKISKILKITKNSISAAYLPFHYSYGLSVITSHLISGAKVFLSKLSIMQSEFWNSIDEFNVSHFPGVPFHYETMTKLGFNRLKLSKISTMTQAGGHLDIELRRNVFNFMDSKGGNFFVMYGQTEAAPRITTLKHEDFLEYIDSVGEALEDGILSINDGLKNEKGFEEGEVIYEGPNVMLGYIENDLDLSSEPPEKRKIMTGDIGYIKDGKLFITGRLKRFAKIFGLRVNLDEVQRLLNEFENNIAVVESKEILMIFCEGVHDESLIDQIQERILSNYTLPLNSIKVNFIEKIPVNERSKINYRKLENYKIV